jgi:hypothetical protein
MTSSKGEGSTTGLNKYRVLRFHRFVVVTLVIVAGYMIRSCFAS